MLKKLFSIVSDQSPISSQQVLTISIGAQHCAFARSPKEAAAQELYSLEWHTGDAISTDDLYTLLSPVLAAGHAFEQVNIQYDYPQSILVPTSLYRPGTEAAIFESCFGVQVGSRLKNEEIKGREITNLYAVPESIDNWMQLKFPRHHHRHSYTLALQDLSPAADGDLHIDFKPDEMSVIAVRGEKVLLAQRFVYHTSADVLFPLVKICQEYSLSPQSVNLQLAGLIDKHSALYKELRQYFMNLEFRKSGWPVVAGQEEPAHFFSALNDMAQCVS